MADVGPAREDDSVEVDLLHEVGVDEHERADAKPRQHLDDEASRSGATDHSDAQSPEQ
jgi:hypothetical protein